MKRAGFQVRGFGVGQVLGDRGILEVEALPFWTGPVQVWPLIGGTTNRNYGVLQADGQRFAVRIGQDKPEHGVMRFNEQAAAKAAARLGISPRIFYAEPGVLVSRLLPGRTLAPQEVARPDYLPRIVAMLRKCHSGMQAHLQGPLLAYWVFQINRNYAERLQRETSRLGSRLGGLLEANAMLEARVGQVSTCYCHNELQAANIFDDGMRLWLLDWDYAGVNSPLFDLANLSANNYFTAEDEATLLSLYFDGPPGRGVLSSFKAFKCAALLREALLSATGEADPQQRFECERRTNDNLMRLSQAMDELD